MCSILFFPTGTAPRKLNPIEKRGYRGIGAGVVLFEIHTALRVFNTPLPLSRGELTRRLFDFLILTFELCLSCQLA